MDALEKITKVHIKTARAYQELVETELAEGNMDEDTKYFAELVTTCEFYEEVKRILEELECEP